MSGARLGMKRLPQLIALMFGTLALQNVQAADDNDALQTVEVRGIRETLKRNLAEKRDSLNVVDSVSAEDLGSSRTRTWLIPCSVCRAFRWTAPGARAAIFSCAAPTRT